MTFTSSEREQINRAVRKAESSTSAEILPVVAGSSGRYDRPEDIVGLWTAMIAIVVMWFTFPAPQFEAGDWQQPSPYWQLAALLVGAVVGFLVGANVGMRVDWLRRLFTPRVQMQEEVAGRARAMFYDQRIHHTAGETGVLLYVSLFEHMVSIVADRDVLDRLGPRRIETLCQQFAARMHDEPLIDAMSHMIDTLGTTLAPLLPREADDLNELPDALVVVD